MKAAKKAALEASAVHTKDAKSTLAGRAEALEMNLKLAKSIQAVVKTQLEVLKAYV